MDAGFIPITSDKTFTAETQRSRATTKSLLTAEDAESAEEHRGEFFYMSSDVQNKTELLSEALKARIAKLTPAQREKLAQRMKSGATAAQAEPALRKRPGLPYPITPEQEHMWLVQQVDPGTYYFNHSHAFRLHGRLDIAAMQRTLDELVRRNENLRTRFPEVDGRPQAEVLSELSIPLELEDISAVP